VTSGQICRRTAATNALAASNSLIEESGGVVPEDGSATRLRHVVSSGKAFVEPRAILEA